MTSPAILVVEDDENLRNALYETLNSEERPVITAENGQEALDVLREQAVGLVISDVQMAPIDGNQLLRRLRKDYPALPTVLMSAYGSVESAVSVMRNGASDFLVKPFDAKQIKHLADKYLNPTTDPDRPVAEDPQSQNLLRVAGRVAKTDATVTISGDSGCGKEVVAKYIHRHSSRANQPFVAINCAAIPESMLEAVLFGHEKGAFTGAISAHAGKFEQANGGTILLDEISEMDLGLQAKLLRVIQEREVERIGSQRTIALDVRVLATTNRDLRQFVADGNFREDLYYRLNVFPLHIAPLRERPADIIPLAEMALAKFASSSARPPVLSRDAESKLLGHSWPGNVRELQNTLQRTLILSQSDTIDADQLIFEHCGVANQHATLPGELQDDVRVHEHRLILDALRNGTARRSDVAKSLGISARTLRYKLARMREQGIDIPGDFRANDTTQTHTGDPR